MAALIWFLLAIDWLVIASLWVLGASQGIGARLSLLLSTIVPIAVAIGLGLTVGPLFFAIYCSFRPRCSSSWARCAWMIDVTHDYRSVDFP